MLGMLGASDTHLQGENTFQLLASVDVMSTMLLMLITTFF